jgi:ABC-type dipeptide/oligopeptide/nickel transport system permease subunit
VANTSAAPATVSPAAVPGPAAGGGRGEFTVESRSATRLVVRRFMRHRLALVSLVVLVLVVLASLVGGRFWRYDYAEITDEFSTPPSLQHPMGTNGVGNDTLAQVLRGAQKSVQIMLLVAVISTVIGVAVGAVAGYYRRWVDAVLMRTIDLVLMVPLLAVSAVLAKKVQDSGSWFGIAIILAAFSWMSVARVVRAEILSLREKEFVEAARAVGASDARIIFRHLLPNVTGSIIVSATLTMALAILLETTLSYLGLGVVVPDTSLGLLVSDGQAAAQTRWWLFYFPGLVIVVIVLCVNFIGDGLRDAFDPRQTRVRA